VERDGVRRALAVLCGLGLCLSRGNAILAVLPVPDAAQTAI
jgi:hypothetical protein